MVSPAVVEMGGVIVTPREQDFQRLDGRSIEEIFAEVSPHGQAAERFAGLMAEHESPPADPGEAGRL